MKILYGLIGFAVVLLFFIINQSLRNKDLKDDIKEAKSQITDSYEFARKEQHMQSDYYYSPVQNMHQINPGNGVPMQDMSRNVEAAFGTAPQRLQSQQFVPEMPVEEPQELSKRELKKQAKAAEKAAKQAAKQAEKEAKAKKFEPEPVQQMQEPMMPQETDRKPQQTFEPFEPTMVKGTVEEPDVDLDMIDL